MLDQAIMPRDYLEEDRLRRIKAGFILRGTTLSAWCRENGVHHQNAHKALSGQWVGPKASMLVERLLAAAGVVR